MKFKRVFRGYDPSQVDTYINETSERELQLRQAQKERIDQLIDENSSLTQQVKQYKMDEQAISKSLIDSQKLAQELKNDAERYSELVLSRAKIFYAAWSAYAQTLVNTLSADELKALNQLQKKIENIINAYEGKDVAQESSAVIEQAKQETDCTVAASATDIMPSFATMTTQRYSNPIEKIEHEAEHVIDLKELVATDESLEQLCFDLGLTK